MIARINLLHIPCNKLGTQSVSPIALIVTLPSSTYINEDRDLTIGIQLMSFLIYDVTRSNSPGNRAYEYKKSSNTTGLGFYTHHGLN